MVGSSVDPHDLQCLTIHELETHAHSMMDKQTRDYYNEGADSGSTLRENSTAYEKYRIRPRVLRDISNLDTSVDIFGHRNSIPVGVAPTAMQCLAHPDGEVATASACREKGVVMGLSSFATKTLEEVAEASGDNPRVLQLYLFEEREHSRKLLRRAKKAGYKAVFLTVDTPMLGRRNMEIRNQFKLPKVYKVANFSEDESTDATSTVMNGASMGGISSGGTGESESLDGPGSSQQNSEANVGKGRSSQPKSQKEKEETQAGYHDGTKWVSPKGSVTFHSHAPNPTLSWENSIDWLKKECEPEMQVWVKGIATAEDAILAMVHGVDGIVVSNHGGRQLNGALATIDALPEIVEAVDGKIPVHVDGGIRHGTDVFKALALGADFVWIGRPVLWGLAYAGQQGVEHALRLLSDEIRLCMGLAGTVKVSDIGKEYLVKMDTSGFVSKL